MMGLLYFNAAQLWLKKIMSPENFNSCIHAGTFRREGGGVRIPMGDIMYEVLSNVIFIKLSESHANVSYLNDIYT